VKHGSLERLIRCEDGNLLAGGVQDFVDIVSDRAFAGAAGNGDKLHIFDGLAVVRAEELGSESLGISFQTTVFVFRLIRGIAHVVIIQQK